MNIFRKHRQPLQQIGEPCVKQPCFSERSALFPTQHASPMITFGSVTRSASALLAALCFSTGLYAQEAGASRVFTLAESLRLAEENNLDIKSAETSLLPAKAGVTQAFGAFLPSVNFNLGYQRRLNDDASTININGQIIPNPSPTPPNSYSMNATANLVVFNGFAREATYNQTKSNLAAVDNNVQYTRSNVLANVRGQYLSILRNQQIVQTHQEDLKLAQQELERIKAQYEVGRLPITSVYSQQADIGAKELAAVQAENQLMIAKSTLLTTLGLHPGTPSDFRSSDIPDTLTSADIAEFRTRIGAFETAVTKAYDNRLDLRASTKRLEAAESGLTASRSGYLPTVSASGGWTWGNTEFSDFGQYGRTFIGLNLSVPIFENFQTNYQIQNATAEYQRNTIEQEQLRQRIASELQQAYLTLEAAEKELDITQRTLLSAEQNFMSASERFRVGAANILDYSTANTQYVNARINRINAVYNYLAARYQVEFSMGTLDR